MTPAQRLAVDFEDQLRLRDDVRHYRRLYRDTYFVALEYRRTIDTLTRQIAEMREERLRLARSVFPDVRTEARL